MAERYRQIAKNEEVYYVPDYPITLEAYAVLYDAKDRKTLAQLKFKNCASKTIIGLIISIEVYDQIGEMVEAISEYHLTNFNALPGESFGSKTPIYFSKDKASTELKVFVEKVLFDDDTLWTSEARVKFEKVDISESLDSTITDPDLLFEYKAAISDESEFIPVILGECSWKCACGEINMNHDECNKCHAKKNDVFEYLELDKLRDAHLNRQFDKAKNMSDSGNVDSIKQAIGIFESISEKRDVQREIKECEDRLKRIAEEKDVEIKENRKKIKIGIVAAVVVVAVIVLMIGIQNHIKSEAAKLLIGNHFYVFNESGEPSRQLLFVNKDNVTCSSEYNLEYAEWLIEDNYTWSIISAKGDTVLLYIDDEECTAVKDSKGDIISITYDSDKYEKMSDEEFQESINENKEIIYQEVLKELEGRDNDKAHSDVKALGDYKDSLAILSELEQYDKIVKNFSPMKELDQEAVFDQAIEFIDTAKYVKFPSDIEKSIKFFGPFVGSWTYSSGDAKVLSYTNYDAEAHKEIEDINILYINTSTNRYNGSIQVYIGERPIFFGEMPVADIENGVITDGKQNTRRLIFSMKDENTLQIEFYPSGNPYHPDDLEHEIVEYTRN